MVRLFRYYRAVYIVVTIISVAAAVWAAVGKRRRTLDTLKKVLKNLRSLKDYSGLKNLA